MTINLKITFFKVSLPHFVTTFITYIASLKIYFTTQKFINKESLIILTIKLVLHKTHCYIFSNIQCTYVNKFPLCLKSDFVLKHIQ